MAKIIRAEFLSYYNSAQNSDKVFNVFLIEEEKGRFSCLTENGKPTLIVEIVAEIEKRSGEHDGVTILGGEPFDQVNGLEKLVTELKKRGFNLTIYSGYKLENLLGRENKKIERILKNTDLLIDGEFKRELKNAGEYRGSSNQRLILEPLLSKYGRKNK